jgi:hypothetical protein
MSKSIIQLPHLTWGGGGGGGKNIWKQDNNTIRQINTEQRCWKSNVSGLYFTCPTTGSAGKSLVFVCSSSDEPLARRLRSRDRDLRLSRGDLDRCLWRSRDLDLCRLSSRFRDLERPRLSTRSREEDLLRSRDVLRSRRLNRKEQKSSLISTLYIDLIK